jgi:hypothetical protein
MFLNVGYSLVGMALVQYKLIFFSFRIFVDHFRHPIASLFIIYLTTKTSNLIDGKPETAVKKTASFFNP